MIHGDGLIATITIGLVAAFIGGYLATRLRLPTILGYLLAGVAIGPYTPGVVGNANIATELAEIGVILLMFSVGLHFSLRDLMSVHRIAIPGALGQIAAATALGVALAHSWGWGLGAGLVFGLALSVASTVVLLRALMEDDTLGTIHGRVAVGWLIVEDLITVLVLVLLPALATLLGTGTQSGPAATGAGGVVATLMQALGKTALFVALMLFVGARAVPWLLTQVARVGTRELFTLAVLAVALGIAYSSAALFGVSLALGAFLAGMVISETDLSHQAAADALPLRDAFTVLFFVSVGMLFNPAILVTSLVPVLAVLAIVVVGKALAGLLIVLALGSPLRTGLTVAMGLAQIGEFSFIVATLGRSLGLLPENGFHLIVAGALISISINPVLFRLMDPVETWLLGQSWLRPWLERRAGAAALTRREALDHELRDHAIICGHGRVGSSIAQLLEMYNLPYVVIDQERRRVEELQRRGVTAFFGGADNTELLSHVGLEHARVLVIAVPDPRATRQIVEYARRVNPRLNIIARTHSDREWAYLRERVSEAILGEREVALEMAHYTLRHFGINDQEVRFIIDELRGQTEIDQPLRRAPGPEGARQKGGVG